MSRTNQHWKKWVRWGLYAVVAADALLLLAAWRTTESGRQAQIAQRDRLREQHALLSEDVKRAADIRAKLPTVQGECDKFVRERLREAGDGYSVVLSDLRQVADSAGLRTSNIAYRQSQQGDRRAPRDIVVVGISVTLDGDYSSLVRFINGLERSPNFYLLDALALSSTSGGAIRMNLELRTYFRV